MKTMIRVYEGAEKERQDFQRFWKDRKVVGFMEEDHMTRIIVDGTWTPSGCARDCGDHYIVARYSQYDRIDKATLQITKDVADR